MAHFAELDENNVVTRVIVVANSDTADVNGVEKEHIGAAFCEKLFGGVWKQTSYNASFRKRYAGAGHTYRADIDAFVTPQPFPSWTLDENANWQPPVAMPTDTNEDGSPKYYSWNEETGAWNVVSMQGA